MQIPVLNGIYASEASDLRTAYPRNLVAVPKLSGVSEGYLHSADGVALLNSGGPGIGRGGINWNGVCYRVMGSKLVRVDNAGGITIIGDVGDDGKQVSMDYSFTYLAVASNQNLFLYNGTTLTQVTDVDLGVVLDVIWVDGYFMTTDGTSLVVGDLNDPFSINTDKYGSSEVDPDPIVALQKYHDEVYALNRYTIEVFDNIGGDFFPFQRVPGAQVQRGCLGTHACCVFMDSIAFIGGGRDEAPSIWRSMSGQSVRLATREIDQVLFNYGESVLSSILLETKIDRGHKYLLVHLPDQTLVYDGAASEVLQQPVWLIMTSSITGLAQYRIRNLVWCYNEWLVTDPQNPSVGHLTNSSSNHWGDVVGWEFNTVIVYNEGRGGIFHELELVVLNGRPVGAGVSTVWTSYSTDGENWSQEKSISTGYQGNHEKRLVWLQQGHMRNWRIQKFRGLSESHMSVMRLEAQFEPLDF